MTVAEFLTWDCGDDQLWQLVDGAWPETPEIIESGWLRLDCIGFAAQLSALYRTTRLSP